MTAAQRAMAAAQSKAWQPYSAPTCTPFKLILTTCPRQPLPDKFDTLNP